MAGRKRVDLRTRLYEKIEVRGPRECWPWRGQTHKGYGVISIGRFRKPHANKVAFRLEYGSIPPGLEIDHLCDNPICCNPAHMEPVTHAENMKRAWRRKKHTSNHPDFICPALRAAILADPRRSAVQLARIYGVSHSTISAWRRAHLRASS